MPSQGSRRNKMQDKNKIVVVAVITLFFLAILYNFHDQKEYNPVSLTIEFQSRTAGFCNLYYDTGKGYNIQEGLTKYVPVQVGFKRVNFIFPEKDISHFKIEFAEKQDSYSIKKVSIKSGSGTMTWGPKEIRSEFSLKNLIILDSTNYSLFSFKQGGIGCPQLICSRDIITLFHQVDFHASKARYIKASIIYLILICLIIFLGNGIVAKLGQAISYVTGHLTSEYLQKNLQYYMIILLIFLFKYFLSSSQHLVFQGSAIYDAGLFLKNAYSIASGNWLGNYDSFTLIKGFFYSFFIAFTNAVGIPLYLAQQLLYFFACILIVQALSPLLRNKSLKIVLFSVLFLNPMTSSAFALRVVREGIYPSLTLLVMASFIAMLLRRDRREGSILRWSWLASGALFAFWNTREEGILLLPLIIGLSMFSILKILEAEGSSNHPGRFIQSIKRKWKTILVLILPYLVLVVGNLSVASLNYWKYGTFLVNEVKSKPFSDAYLALTQIDHPDWQPTVPVTKSAREKAYKISPAFAKLEPYLDEKNNHWRFQGEGNPVEIKGGWFIWAFREAADRAGFHKNLPQSQAFYREVSTQINSAFQKGMIAKTKNISTFGIVWDNRYTRPVLGSFKKGLRILVTFSGYVSNPSIFKGDLYHVAFYQSITNEPGYIPVDIDNLNGGFGKMKFEMLDLIAVIYHILNPIIFIISVLSYLCFSFFAFFRARNNENFIKWLILTFMGLIIVTRLLLMAYITVSQWEALTIRYLSMVYPFLLLFEFLSICFFVDFIKPNLSLLRKGDNLSKPQSIQYRECKF